MSLAPLPANDRYELTLAEYCDNAAAIRLHNDLLPLSGMSEITINAEKVSRIATAALQVILAAVQEFSAAGDRCVIVHPSEVFVTAWSSLGFDPAPLIYARGV